METNVCSIDRTVRLSLGAVLAAVGIAALGGVLATAPVVGAVALVVGVVLLGTGATQLCPVYRLLGINTCGD
ncbi:hypothetical protein CHINAEXTREME_00540 [Halobiforma lacisalsi AJ5]|uniref:Inner membrane protein YgaP-like transmembrane domain-containing protein n=2 Tax=Natronobacterium TaxID=2256 RepID=M0L1E9_NATLA|nr:MULTISPECIES: DUF2892 domain-containing protein [Halobiforma]APW96339.1 hypothetical protein CHINAEXTREME_00540 [Halobiforma lacisalsi AJ5]EMA27387.1 hypothetical protein C445_20445 [Halobiforma lacisalsi AJ5]SFB72594.1 Protein of unknown function [Halobiforma haloterrestris]